jgi:hypothetical protein
MEATRKFILIIALTISFSGIAAAQQRGSASATTVSKDGQDEPENTLPNDQQNNPPTRAREICTDQNDSRAVIDRIHSSLYKLTCSSASWFDGLFGNSRYDEDYRATHGSLTTGAQWSQRQAWQEVLRFQLRMYLPQMNRRLHAFIGRVDRNDYVTESQSDVYSLPEQFNRDINETTLVGIGYNEPLTKRGSFDFSTGVQLSIPLDPYVKGSYRFARPIGELNLLRLRETVFWQNSEQLGVTSRIDWDRAIGDRHLARYTVSGTFSQVSEGMRWFTTLTLFHFLSSDRALAYEVAANGSTDRQVPLSDYGTSVIFRQRLSRDWLLLELRGGVDFPRDFVFEERRSNLNAGIAIEMRFGGDARETHNELSNTRPSHDAAQ